MAANNVKLNKKYFSSKREISDSQKINAYFEPVSRRYVPRTRFLSTFDLRAIRLSTVAKKANWDFQSAFFNG